MYTARFYRRNKNEWVYVFSKLFENQGDIKELSLTSNLKAEVFDEDYEKVRVYTP